MLHGHVMSCRLSNDLTNALNIVENSETEPSDMEQEPFRQVPLVVMNERGSGYNGGISEGN